ncbi:putative B-box type zinc finger family protein [Hibiscus syriacus]|uniref:B-box type zinc finger family protein n=1 Tax=Hibiscus syriacus TaxID=106335 RepID=A0A6A2XQ55_HIBSY|nr:putative B-box type zinc finger family protein [Hibiscus syriacus]
MIRVSASLLQCYSDFRDCKVPDGDGLCESLNMNNVQLSFETAEEIFVSSQGQTRYQFEKIGTDCLIMDKTLSVTKSNGPIGNMLEASPEQKEFMPFPISQVCGSASMMAATSGTSNCIFGKQIRYASHKARADTRKRVKGRFVKAGEEYDYDPLVARNC